MGQASAAPVATPRTSDPPLQDGGSAQRRREYDSKIGKCMDTEWVALYTKNGELSSGWKGHQAEHHTKRKR